MACLVPQHVLDEGGIHVEPLSHVCAPPVGLLCDRIHLSRLGHGSKQVVVIGHYQRVALHRYQAGGTLHDYAHGCMYLVV